MILKFQHSPELPRGMVITQNANKLKHTHTQTVGPTLILPDSVDLRQAMNSFLL